MSVTTHAIGSRLQKLASASSLPKAPKAPVAPKSPLAPKAPKAPVAPQRTASKIPGKVVPKPRPNSQRMNVNRADEDAVLGSLNETASNVAGDIDLTPTASRSRNQSINKIDLSKIDPGPEIADVPCGFNCGSCSHFIKLDDPRRDDPQFMEDYLRLSSSCPVAILELVKLKGKDVNEVLAKANSTACPKFKLNPKRASTNLKAVIEAVRCLEKGEFDILASNMDKIARDKSMEGRYGCRIGEVIKTRLQGFDHPVDAKVTGFQGKSIVARVIHLGKTYMVKLPVVEARVIED